jgi:glutathione S-transferase
MITLYGFGPHFGMPDGSPFVIKCETLLKMSGQPYKVAVGTMSKAPKGKLPMIEDDGVLIPDSTFIRFHLEAKYGLDLDAGYSRAERGIAWAFEKMCEEHLYWANVDARWQIDRNFDAGPRQFFAGAPAPIRPLVIGMVRRKVSKSLRAQGLGRHSRGEIETLAIRDIDALSDFMGDKPYLLGDRPCAADASVFGSMWSISCPIFETPLRTAVEKRANLVAYRDRMRAQYFPDFAAKAA